MSNKAVNVPRILNINDYLSLTSLEGISTGDVRLPVVLTLAETCGYESAHTWHVTHLALSLFDQLSGLHRLGLEEKFWLEAAAILHDIGWVDGWRGHHKSSLRIILQTTHAPVHESRAFGDRFHCALPSESPAGGTT